MEDNGAKLIFGNPTLCAQLLRDYSNIELLKNVQAEDITDVTERYIPMFTEERNADVVKQVRLSDGEEKWTADNSLKSRIALSDFFLPYVPDYEYHLVNTADHNKAELIKKNDGLSLLMILNKVRNTAEFNSLNLPREYVDNLSANSPEDVLDVLARVIAVLLRKHRVSEDEIQDFVSQIKERRMSDLFANFKATVNVEERKIGQNKGEVIKLIKIVRAKYLKGQDVEQIAEDLVESVETVSEIYEVVKSHEADYDVDKLYDELEKVKKR